MRFGLITGRKLRSTSMVGCEPRACEASRTIFLTRDRGQDFLTGSLSAEFAYGYRSSTLLIRSRRVGLSVEVIVLYEVMSFSKSGPGQRLDLFRGLPL